MVVVVEGSESPTQRTGAWVWAWMLFELVSDGLETGLWVPSYESCTDRLLQPSATAQQHHRKTRTDCRMNNMVLDGTVTGAIDIK